VDDLNGRPHKILKQFVRKNNPIFCRRDIYGFNDCHSLEIIPTFAFERLVIIKRVNIMSHRITEGIRKPLALDLRRQLATVRALYMKIFGGIKGHGGFIRLNNDLLHRMGARLVASVAPVIDYNRLNAALESDIYDSQRVAVDVLLR